MGCSRMGYDLLSKQGIKNFMSRKRVDYRLVFEDTIMPLICKIVGHVEYHDDLMHDPGQTACRRCHHFIKSGQGQKDDNAKPCNKLVKF